MNAERLFELRDEIGPEDLAEVIDLFLTEIASAIADLAARAPQPPDEAEFHFIKSSALNLGFDQLAALCATGETAARLGEPVAITGLHLSETFASERRALEIALNNPDKAAPPSSRHLAAHSENQ